MNKYHLEIAHQIHIFSLCLCYLFYCHCCKNDYHIIFYSGVAPEQVPILNKYFISVILYA